jgi:hypothetical protein
MYRMQNGEARGLAIRKAGLTLLAALVGCNPNSHKELFSHRTCGEQQANELPTGTLGSALKKAR